MKHKAGTNPTVQDLTGWMVLGMVSEGGTVKPRAIPVLAASASSAMNLAADSLADFSPVGIMSENELRAHLASIECHRASACAVVK